MTSERVDLIDREYAAGKAAFERGNYRESVRFLERASALVDDGTKLSGEILIWLVTAYEAAGERSQAVSLCRKITQHPDLKTRQQSKRLLYIMEAPQLKTRREWLSEIPDLSNLSDNEGSTLGTSKFAAAAPPKRPAKPKSIVPEPVDLTQVNTQDNLFIWVALGGALVIIGALVWFA